MRRPLWWLFNPYMRVQSCNEQSAHPFIMDEDAIQKLYEGKGRELSSANLLWCENLQVSPASEIGDARVVNNHEFSEVVGL